MIEVDYHNGEDEQFDYDKLGNREFVTLRDESVETYAVNYLTNRYDNDQGEDIVCEYDDAGNTDQINPTHSRAPVGCLPHAGMGLLGPNAKVLTDRKPQSSGPRIN